METPFPIKHCAGYSSALHRREGSQMLIIAGYLRMVSEHRDEYVASHRDLVRRARAHPGCLDFTIAADSSR